MNLRVLAFAAGIAACGCSLGCHRSAQVTIDTAPRQRLTTFRTATLEVVAETLTPEARADLAQELETQLTDSRLFTRIGDRASMAPADAALRVTLLDVRREDVVTVTFRVELADVRERAARLVARFDVTTDSHTTGIHEGGGAAFGFEDKTERAIDKAVRAIVAQLDDYAD